MLLLQSFFILSHCSILISSSFTDSYKKTDAFLRDLSFYEQIQRQILPWKNSMDAWNTENLTFNQFRSKFLIGKYTLPPETIRITKTVAIKVPQYIPLPQNIPYPVPLPISKPFPVEVPKIVTINNSINNNPRALDSNYGTQSQLLFQRVQQQNQHPDYNVQSLDIKTNNDINELNKWAQDSYQYPPYNN